MSTFFESSRKVYVLYDIFFWRFLYLFVCCWIEWFPVQLIISISVYFYFVISVFKLVLINTWQHSRECLIKCAAPTRACRQTLPRWRMTYASGSKPFNNRLNFIKYYILIPFILVCTVFTKHFKYILMIVKKCKTLAFAVTCPCGRYVFFQTIFDIYAFINIHSAV